MADVVETIGDHKGKVANMPSVATEAEDAIKKESGKWKPDILWFFAYVLQSSRGRLWMSIIVDIISEGILTISLSIWADIL